MKTELVSSPGVLQVHITVLCCWKAYSICKAITLCEGYCSRKVVTIVVHVAAVHLPGGGITTILALLNHDPCIFHKPQITTCHLYLL